MSRRLKQVKRVIRVPFEWLGILLGLLMIVGLSRRALLAVCDCASAVMFVFDRRGRRFAHEHLLSMFGERMLSPRSERTIVRRSYRNMARTVGYAFWSCFRAKERCRASGYVDGATAEFLAANHPAVTVSGHIGCWEILSQLAYLEGHEIMSVAKDIGTRGMTRLLMWARRSIGQEIISAEGAFKPLMQGLKDGKSLGLLVDQKVSPKKGGIWVRFLGKPMPVSAAPAFFAAKAKVPIIVAWSHPLKDGRYRCVFIRSYEPSEARDIWALTQSIADDLARVIRRHPSCWVLNYNYFRATPDETELRALQERENQRKQF